MQIKIKRGVSFLTILFSWMIVLVYAEADFTRDNEQIVTDNITNLQWQDDNDAKTVTKSWVDAISYCEELTLGGYTDWRLPNINELKIIIDRTKQNPEIASGFQNTNTDNPEDDYYWSSTSYNGDKEYAWIVYFGNGNINIGDKEYDSNAHVRCVRDGQ